MDNLGIQPEAVDHIIVSHNFIFKWLILGYYISFIKYIDRFYLGFCKPITMGLWNQLQVY